MACLPVIAQIDPVTLGNTQFRSYSGTPIGPYFNGNNRYITWFNLGNGLSEARKSVDGGLTWLAQDQASAPTSLQASIQTPSSPLIRYATTAPDSKLHIGGFNMATDLWTPVGATGPTGALTIWGLGWYGTTLRVCFGTSVFVADYDTLTDTWTPKTLVAITPQCWVARVDPNGKWHIVYGNTGPKTFNYLQVLPDNTITAPVSIAFGNLNVSTWPGFIGSKLVIPARLASGNIAVAIVDPYTSTTPTITLVDLGYAGFLPMATEGNGLVYIFFGDSTNSLNYVTYDGANFGPKVLWYDHPNCVPLGVTGPLQNPMPPTIKPDGGRADIFQLDCFGSWYAEDPGQPAPVLSAGPALGGTRRMVVLVPNYWDHSLWKEVDPTRKIPQRSVCCVRDPLDYFKWIRMPEGAIEFRKVGAIPTPLAAAGDVLVLRFTVPMGYDGVIHGLTQHYTGPGFLEGNGDIEWRLRINRTYAQYLGNVLVSLGSLNETHPLDDGIPVYSLQSIEYLVNVPNLSGGILPVNSQIVCVVVGYVWPRR